MRSVVVVAAVLFVALGPVRAQDTPPPAHDHAAMMAAEQANTGWMAHVHGYAFLTTNYQSGPSGDRDFESTNHLMVEGSHALWGGRVSLLGTFSLEPVTIPPEGSPLLFQRGETYHGVLLVDRQHPHDLFLQLAAAWDRKLSESISFRAYLAPEGEPPVGPAAYTHRLSASAIPTAPLSHHNIDSTHLSANVVSAGFTFGMVTVEAGAFHGGEPDENRFDLDFGPIDSYAGRVTVQPVAGLSLQVSAARRTKPESTEDGNQTRQTISGTYERPLTGGVVAATLAYGRNLLPDNLEERGLLLEALWKFHEHHTVTARFESVDRDVYELINKAARPETVPPQSTLVDAFTFGYLHDLPWPSEIDTAAGITATVYRFDSILDPTYGDRPYSGQLFVRLTFGQHGAAGAHHHH